MDFLATTFTFRDIVLLIPVVTLVITIYIRVSTRINTLEIKYKNLDDKQVAFEKVYSQDNHDSKEDRKSILNKLDKVSSDIADVRVLIAKVGEAKRNSF